MNKPPVTRQWRWGFLYAGELGWQDRVWNAVQPHVRVDALLLRNWRPPRRFGFAYRMFDWDVHIFVLRPFHLGVRFCYWAGGRWMFHRLLMKLGLLKRDAILSDLESGYYKNMRWQWRFWRGPYRDLLERDARADKQYAINALRNLGPFNWLRS